MQILSGQYQRRQEIEFLEWSREHNHSGVACDRTRPVSPTHSSLDESAKPQRILTTPKCSFQIQRKLIPRVSYGLNIGAILPRAFEKRDTREFPVAVKKNSQKLADIGIDNNKKCLGLIQYVSVDHTSASGQEFAHALPNSEIHWLPAPSKRQEKLD